MGRCQGIIKGSMQWRKNSFRGQVQKEMKNMWYDNRKKNITKSKTELGMGDQGETRNNGGLKKLTKLSFYENVISDLLLFILGET